MFLKVRAPGQPPRRFAWWSLAIWLILLFAVIGGIQYQRQGAWLYLTGAFAVIVLCAGCALRQEWSRRPMQAAALALACWALVTGILMLIRWHGFQQDVDAAVAQLQDATDEIRQLLAQQIRRTYLVGVALKMVSVPLLVWLAWQLGLPQVREQFHTRRT